MMSKNLLLSALILSAAALAPASEVVFSTSFEAADDAGYTNGASVSGVQGFNVATGTVQVTNSVANTGSQSVELAQDSVLDRPFSNQVGSPAFADRIVWVSGYFRGTGSSTAPQIDQIGAASAVVYFSDTSIQVLDGSTDTFVTTGASLSGSAFTGILLKLDFDAGAKNFDAYIDGSADGFTVGERTNTGVEFFDTTLNGLSGFQQLASEPGFLDDFEVRSWVPFDANNDADVDVADLVTVVNEINASGTVLTNPLAFTNADAGDLNGTIDGSDVTAITNALLNI